MTSSWSLAGDLGNKASRQTHYLTVSDSLLQDVVYLSSLPDAHLSPVLTCWHFLSLVRSPVCYECKVSH